MFVKLPWVCWCVRMCVSVFYFCAGIPGLAAPWAARRSVMTEDQWLGLTSCGSPGLKMCHRQGRPTGASLQLVGCFPCVQTDSLGG